jgi:hypothetical protein
MASNMTDLMTSTAAPRPGGCPLSLYKTSSYLVARWLRINRFYIQLPIAVVGAIMVFLVYGRKITKGSPYLFMCVLTLADTGFILMDTIFHKVPIGLVNIDPGAVGCGIIEYMFHNTQMFAVAVLVFMMFERMLMTLLPPRLHVFSTRRTAIALILLCISVFAINIPYTYSKFSRRFKNPLQGTTYFRCFINGTNMPHVLPVIYIKMYVFFFIAMAILLFCSIATTIKICLMRKTRDVDSKSNYVGDKKNDVENANRDVANGFVGRGKDRVDDLLRDITAQVLTVSICFIVLALPYGIMFVPYSPVSKLGTGLKLSCDEGLFVYVFSEISKFLYDMQHCLNAYLYCLSGRIFRRKLARKLRCRKRESDKYVMSETTVTEMPSIGGDVTANGTNGTADMTTNGRI